jgi:hypothetical protein
MNPAVRGGFEGGQALETGIHRLIPDSLSTALQKARSSTIFRSKGRRALICIKRASGSAGIEGGGNWLNALHV